MALALVTAMPTRHRTVLEYINAKMHFAPLMSQRNDKDRENEPIPKYNTGEVMSGSEHIHDNYAVVTLRKVGYYYSDNEMILVYTNEQVDITNTISFTGHIIEVPNTTTDPSYCVAVEVSGNRGYHIMIEGGHFNVEKTAYEICTIPALNEHVTISDDVQEKIIPQWEQLIANAVHGRDVRRKGETDACNKDIHDSIRTFYAMIRDSKSIVKTDGRPKLTQASITTDYLYHTVREHTWHTDIHLMHEEINDIAREFDLEANVTCPLDVYAKLLTNKICLLYTYIDKQTTEKKPKFSSS